MEEEEEDRQCIRRGQTAGKRVVDLFFFRGAGADNIKIGGRCT